MQEAWELMFDSVDTLSACVRIATGILSTIKINPERMRSGLSADMLATDLAEYLVRKGVVVQASWALHCLLHQAACEQKHVVELSATRTNHPHK